MIEEITIEINRVPYLKDSIEKLNKKARKLNCPEMVLTFSNETVRYEFDDNLTENTIVYVDAILDYEIPIIDGWELICTFDIEMVPDEDPMVLTSKVPDKVIPPEYLNKTEIHCDHCGLTRNRHHSMLMRKVETGEHKEVGSTCIKDFFGHSPQNFLWMAKIRFSDILGDIDAEHFPSGMRINSYAFALDKFMGMTARCIREYGWKSRGAAYNHGGTSTSDHVMDQLWPPRPIPENWVILEIEDEDKKIAKETIEYFENLDPEDNDYLVNCTKVVKLGYVPRKQIGVAASMVQTYKRSYEEAKAKAERKVSNWVGEEKERLELDLECVYEMNVESFYGVSTLYIFVDENGNKFKTFYSGSKWSVEKGDKVSLKGTVKKHEEYKNEKATMLTRCAVTVKE